MLPGGSRKICMIQHIFPGFDLYYPDLAQHLITSTSGHDRSVDYLSVNDLSVDDLSVDDISTDDLSDG